MVGCKGVCYSYKTGKNPDGSKYGNGKKRCSVCEVFIECGGSFCPCCGYRLKTRPKNRKYKEKFREREK